MDCSSNTPENKEKFGKDYGNRGFCSGIEYNQWKFNKDHGALPETAYPYRGKLGVCAREKEDPRVIVPKGKVLGFARVA